MEDEIEREREVGMVVGERGLGEARLVGERDPVDADETDDERAREEPGGDVPRHPSAAIPRAPDGDRHSPSPGQRHIAHSSCSKNRARTYVIDPAAPR